MKRDAADQPVIITLQLYVSLMPRLQSQLMALRDMPWIYAGKLGS
ncbi:hypothetical protein ACQ3G6_11235 [Allorhizobium undicola]|nr:hypothetical protein [Allorhizobium undicola]